MTGNTKLQDIKDLEMWLPHVLSGLKAQMPRVFLGGTCNNSTWRDDIIPYLANYFNPVVGDWNQEAQDNEIRERQQCDFCLYAITPKMHGTYSIAEVVDDSNKRPSKTILVLLAGDGLSEFTLAQWKSLVQVSKMVEANGGTVFTSLYEAAEYINN